MAEHIDVVIVGAGLSGIGSAYHLQTSCPDQNYAILEGRADLGGTWDLFRYPGIRSDSDMHTLGFSFKPWTNPKSIADGPSILDYIRSTAHEYGIDRHIRFGHRVIAADWSSDSARWSLTIDRDGETIELTCNFVFMCSGYYSYKGGYTPEFTDRACFNGPIVHPQKWPDDLDYADKSVVVIGSGATAVTLVPALAEKASHVTMLQRSATYMVARPDTDVWANRLRRFLPERLAYRLTRRKNIARAELVYNRTRTHPEQVKNFLLGELEKEVGPEEVTDNFTPSYNPWDQRLCLVPNGDLFAAMRDKRASVVTAEIERFTETGIQLRSGVHLDADIIITATGLQLVTIGDMDFAVDGQAVDFANTFTYKGLGYSGIPNLISTCGYINASWTLRADLVSAYGCRLLNQLRTTGTRSCTPTLRAEDQAMTPRPWIDNFSSGYMQRMMPMMPKQGDKAPWLNTQRFREDRELLGKGPVDDGVMIFSR